MFFIFFKNTFSTTGSLLRYPVNMVTIVWVFTIQGEFWENFVS